MKFLHYATLLAAIFILHGCAIEQTPDVDIRNAVLMTPKGEIEFERTSNRSVLFKAGGIYMTLFPVRGHHHLRSAYLGNILIKENEAYYQLNDNKKERLSIGRSAEIPNGFEIAAPATMDYYIYDGDGLHVTEKRLRLTKENKEKVRQETYRYRIPFTIDNDEYAIDVTFRLDIDSRLRSGAPGMP